MTLTSLFPLEKSPTINFSNAKNLNEIIVSCGNELLIETQNPSYTL